MKKPKIISKMDAMDLEAEREGSAIKKSNENREENHGKKIKVRSVDSKILDKTFNDNIGCDYVSKRD